MRVIACSGAVSRTCRPTWRRRTSPSTCRGWARVSADVVWGGNYFGIIDISGKGLEIGPDTGTKLSQSASPRARCCERRSACNIPPGACQQLQLRHALARGPAARRLLQERARVQRRPARPFARRHRHVRHDGDVPRARQTRAQPADPVGGSARHRHVRGLPYRRDDARQAAGRAPDVKGKANIIGPRAG